MAQLNIMRTNDVLNILEKFLNDVWDHEPQDIKNLRTHSLPPMGNLPCVFYANFNTFWLGENVQVYRQIALEEKVELSELNTLMSAVLWRHASRLKKWKLNDTVNLLENLGDFYSTQGPQSYQEFVSLAEAILVSLDRVNSWIDAIIPWSELDKHLALRQPIDSTL